MIPAPPPYVSDLEAMLYYRGLPSKPRLIARTGSPWPWEAPNDPEAPSGPDAYPPAQGAQVPGRTQDPRDLGG
jgi:hypothetical protein